MGEGEVRGETSNGCRDPRECRVGGRSSPLKVTELYVLSFYNGRTTVRPYKGLHVSHEHSNLLTIVLIPLYVRVPKTIPLLELFSSNGGTF